MSLFVVAIVWGAAAAWFFRKTVDASALRVAINLIVGSLLETRLYFDQPRIVWRAQMALLLWNGRLFRILATPLLATGISTALLVWGIAKNYETKPLAIGEPTVVTAQLRRNVPARLVAPQGLAVETKPARSIADRQVSWRVRPTGRRIGSLQLWVGKEHVESPLEGTRRTFFHSGDVEWIEVDYPRNSGWVWWFGAISTVSACVTSLLL